MVSAWRVSKCPAVESLLSFSLLIPFPFVEQAPLDAIDAMEPLIEPFAGVDDPLEPLVGVAEPFEPLVGVAEPLDPFDEPLEDPFVGESTLTGLCTPLDFFDEK